MRLFKIIVNWTPKMWLPLAIVLLNGVINFSEKSYLFEYLDLFKLDLFKTLPNMYVISGFFAIAGALIDWILISVLLFFGCRLLYKSEGVFRNFFKIIGLCHLVLLVATLSRFIFTLTNLHPELTMLEAETSLELPMQVINIAGHICFALILVPVVQVFFQIRWVQAFCTVCISYAIYWILSEALLSIFLHVFLFFFGQSLVPSWQPGIQISP
jgi:hypothetical protein